MLRACMTGIIFFIDRIKRPFVRFHAAQSIVALFGALTIIRIGLGIISMGIGGFVGSRSLGVDFHGAGIARSHFVDSVDD